MVTVTRWHEQHFCTSLLLKWTSIFKFTNMTGLLHEKEKWEEADYGAKGLRRGGSKKELKIEYHFTVNEQMNE